VIGPGGLDADLDPSVDREQPPDRVDDLAQGRRRHRAAQPGLQQLASRGVGDRDGELVLADIDGHRDRRGRDWDSMNNHGTHLRGCRKTTAQQRRTFELRNLTVPSKHLRRCP